MDQGVGLIDTADAYGPGVVEDLVGRALTSHPDVLVVAKVGQTRPDRGWRADGRPEHLRSACHASLRRLRTDQVPLLMLHRPDPDIPVEESMGTLAELATEGKARHLGVGNVTVDQLRRARSVAPIVAVQNRLSVRHRESDPVLAECERTGTAFLAWGPTHGHDEIAAVALAATALAIDERSVALAWLLARSPVVVPIPGTSSIVHLDQNLAAGAPRTAPRDRRRHHRRRHGRDDRGLTGRP